MAARRVTGWVVASAFACAACDSDTRERPDAEVIVDAGPRDSSVAVDAGRDGGATNDAGHVDDAGPDVDTGVDVDAGNDAGVVDAGPTIPPIADTNPQVLAISPTGHDRFFDVAWAADGAIYVVGIVANGVGPTADARTVVARFQFSGALDTTWASGGYAFHNLVAGGNGEVARSIALQADGRIVVAATIEHPGAGDPRDRDVAIVRLTSDGVLDPTFGVGGVRILDLSDGVVSGAGYVADAAWGLAIDSADRVLIHGSRARNRETDADCVVVRLTANGTLDTTFGSERGIHGLDLDGAHQTARGIVTTGDSIVAGGIHAVTGLNVPLVYRLTGDGTLDDTFNSNGVFATPLLPSSSEAAAITRHGSGIVVVGAGRAVPSDDLDWLVARLGAEGTLDSGFAGDGLVEIDFGGLGDNPRDVVVLPADRLLVVGGARPAIDDDVDGAVAVLDADGDLDASFDVDGRWTADFGGPADTLWGVAIAPGPNPDRYVAVGIRGASAPSGDDDDAVLVVRPLP